MKKLLLVFCMTMLSSIFVFGQDDDYHKFEVFGGYSNNQVDLGISDDENDVGDFFDDRASFNGVNVSGVGNFSRYVGVRGDFSAHYKDLEFDVPTISGTTITRNRFKVNASVYNFSGGIQVKDNVKEGSRFRPFGYGLIGVAHGRSKIDDSFFTSPFCQQTTVNCREGFRSSDTGISGTFGGGIDIKASERISIRAIQADYNPTRLNGTTQNNFRFGVGVVFH
jgi:hypothetical protein